MTPALAVEAAPPAPPRNVNNALKIAAAYLCFSATWMLLVTPHLDVQRTGVQTVHVDAVSDVLYIIVSTVMLYWLVHIGETRTLAALESMQTGNERLHRVTRMTTDWYWEQDADFRFTFLSGQAGEAIEFSSKQSIGGLRWDTPALNLDETGWAAHRAILERHEPFRDFELCRPTRSGSPVWISVSGDPKFSADGRFMGYVGVARTITDRKRVESTLRETSHLHKCVFDSMHEGVLIVGLDKRHIFANPAACRIIGMPESELLGRRWGELGVVMEHEDGRPYDVEERPASRVLANGEAFFGEVAQGLRLDGSRIWVSMNAVPLLDESGAAAGVVVTFEDRTAAITASHALAESEARLSGVVEASTDAVIAVDPDNRLVLFNKAAERIFGYDRSQVLGQPVDRLIPERFRKDHHKRMLTTGAGSRGMSPDRRVEGLRANGETFPLEAQIGKLTMNGTALYAAFLSDVTERVAREKALQDLMERLEERVEERTSELTEAYSELERFSYSVSHDLRAPLRAMGAFSEVLLHSARDKLDEGERRQLERIAANATLMNQLLQGVLDYSRSTSRQIAPASCDLDRLVTDIIDSGRVHFPAAEIRVGPLGSVVGDATMLHQIFQNLVGNALKYSSKQAAPKVEISRTNDRESCTFIVRDNGCGFDMSHAGDLFKLFRRMHKDSEFEGTGIGLATVKRLVERHGGCISAVSDIDSGSTFSVTLPAAVGAASRRG